MAAAPPRSVADATHELYRQYGKQIYAYCLHQLRNREEAEDAVQTTFLNAFRGLQRGTTTRFEQAWLYKIAQNVCIARRSSSGRRLKLEAPDDFEILQEVVPSGASGGDGDTLELMGLDSALDSMPENQRRAILLREWQGLSYREIATELGLTQGAVEMLIFRARRTLAMALEQPDVAERKRGRAKTGFSFGSLIAAMKSLFSGGAALKMAAVAVSAAVVGTNAVHTVVHQTFAPARHAHRTTLGASGGPTPSVGSGTKVAAHLVAYRTSHPYTAAASTPAAATPASTASSPGHEPVLADAVPAATAATPAEPAAASPDTASAQSASPVVISASAAAAAPTTASASSATSPQSTSTVGGGPRSGPPTKSPTATEPPLPPTTSRSAPGGAGSTGSDDGRHHGSGHGHRKNTATGTTSGSGSTDQPAPQPPQGPVATPYASSGGPSSPTTTTTTSTVPVATPYDPGSGAQGQPTTTTTTTTTTDTTTTTTTTSDGGDSSSSGSDDGNGGGGGGNGGGGDHGHHHQGDGDGGGGGGGGGNGNGGGNGGGGGHHHGH